LLAEAWSADNDTTYSKPNLKTTKDLARHVSEIYTYASFYKFQKEFCVAFMDCEVDDKQVIEERHVITIVDNSQNWGIKNQVAYNLHNQVGNCSCKMFECEVKYSMPSYIMCFERKRLV